MEACFLQNDQNRRRELLKFIGATLERSSMTRPDWIGLVRRLGELGLVGPAGLDSEGQMPAPGQAGTTTMVRQSGVGLVEPTGKGMSVWAESAFGPSWAALGPRMA